MKLKYFRMKLKYFRMKLIRFDWQLIDSSAWLIVKIWIDPITVGIRWWIDFIA